MMFGHDFETRVLAKTYAGMTLILVLAAFGAACAGDWLSTLAALIVAVPCAGGWWYWVASE